MSPHSKPFPFVPFVAQLKSHFANCTLASISAPVPVFLLRDSSSFLFLRANWATWPIIRSQAWFAGNLVAAWRPRRWRGGRVWPLRSGGAAGLTFVPSVLLHWKTSFVPSENSQLLHSFCVQVRAQRCFSFFCFYLLQKTKHTYKRTHSYEMYMFFRLKSRR